MLRLILAGGGKSGVGGRESDYEDREEENSERGTKS